MGCGASASRGSYGPKNLCPNVASRGRWNDLMEEAEKGNLAGVNRKLAQYDVNAGDPNSWTALLEACEKRHGTIVDALLRANANPNLADNKGWTPIMAAAEGGDARIARSLLNAKANVEYQDRKGWTCIMEAAEKGNAAMVKEFVGVANPKTLNTKDDRGWSAFMAACEGGTLECVKLLWIHGAEHHTDYIDGHYGGLVQVKWTALSEAKANGHRDIVAYLEPILEAETNLTKMVETDDWNVGDALQYMERAQQAWCLKGLVMNALERLRSKLEQHIIDTNALDREQCFDWLVNINHGSDNNCNNSSFQTSNQALQNAMGEICRGRLNLAMKQRKVGSVKWAMISAVRSNVASDISKEMQEATELYKQLMEIPPDWDIEAMTQQLDGTGRMIHKKAIEDEAILKQIQHFLNQTLRKKYTRDRRGEPVPDFLQVVKLVSVQNEQLYKEYSLRVKQLPASCILPKKMPKLLTEGGAPFLGPLTSEINEAWLWHGTNESAADAITTEDFRLNLAGSNAGTLYGPGIYFGDSGSKSDEYTAPSANGIRCLLLCRVALGRVLYTDEIQPDAQQLTQKCLSHEFDSVLGDREACRGTFKEIIVFDDDLAYPEYIIYYHRIHK